MADEKIPADPVKTGTTGATETTGATPKPKPSKTPSAAKPAKKSGNGKSTKKTAKAIIKDEASKLSKQAGEKARGYAKDGKARASGTIDEFAKMIDDAAGNVDDRFGKEYGKYARSAAGQVSGLAESLRGKEVDELLDDVRSFVRSSPAVAIGAAAAFGFAFARVLKSGIDEAGNSFDDDLD